MLSTYSVIAIYTNLALLIFKDNSLGDWLRHRALRSNLWKRKNIFPKDFHYNHYLKIMQIIYSYSSS